MKTKNCPRCARDCSKAYLTNETYGVICRLCHKQLYALKQEEFRDIKYLQEDVKWLHEKLDFANPKFLSDMEHDKQTKKRLNRLYWFANFDNT